MSDPALASTVSEAPKKAQQAWPDRLRNLSTVMVILIHAAAPIAHGEGMDYNGSWWWSGNFWNSLTRPGVPLFVMLSGYLLLGKDYPLPDFLKRRFTRVVIPAIFWMVVYSFYNYMANGKPATIVEAFRGIVTGPVHYHLWFIYLIIGLYLVYPMLRPWVRTATQQDYLYLFVMSAFCTWVYKFIATAFGMWIGVYFELFTNNVGYFVLGYYLGTFVPGEAGKEPSMAVRFFSKKYTPVILIVAGTLFTMFGSYWLNIYSSTDPAQVYFYDYLTPNVAIASVGWFLLAKRTFNSRPLLDIERDFTAASFGVYFAHVLVMDWWGKCGYWHSMAHPIYITPMLATMIASMTFLAVALIRVLPGGTRVT